MTQAHDHARTAHDTHDTYEARDSDEARDSVRCPYCGATATEPLALFGQQLLTVQMYCQGCHTPFEYVKDDAILRAFEARKGNQS